MIDSIDGPYTGEFISPLINVPANSILMKDISKSCRNAGRQVYRRFKLILCPDRLKV